MLTLPQMRSIARGRVTDAAVLIRSGRYDTAVHLCGYAVEMVMKARVCRTLGWAEFPSEPKEWQRQYAHLKVHDLKLLVQWTGVERQINAPPYQLYWQQVITWNPEARYSPPGRMSRRQSILVL